VTSAAGLLAGVCSAALAQAPAITLEHFGVGDHARPGDTIGIRLSVAAELERPTTIEVVWELPDGNGDLAQVSRTIVLSPGERAPVWLYARLPARLPASAALDDVTVVRLFEERDGRRMRQVAATRISGSSGSMGAVAVECDEDLIGVVGNGRMGLDVFATPWPGTSTIPSMNAVTKIARGIRSLDMPDSWQGLAPFQAIIWTQENPQALSGDAAKAVREWIFRGGNFIIVVPEAAEPWGVLAPVQHPLADLMPAWTATKHDAVPVRDLLPIVTNSADLRSPSATSPLVVFSPPPARDAYEPLLLLPTPRDARTGFPAPRQGTLDGAVIALRRSFGHGHITLLGLDVDGLNRRALTAEGLPQGDIFWNRLLGRRADTPSMAQYRAMDDATPPTLVTRGVHLDDMGRGVLVADAIGMRGQAALGILGAFLFFLVYWTLAGPGGYGLLVWRGMQRHAWSAFTLVALVFAAGIWLLGGTLTGQTVRLQHLTFLDSVHRSAKEERPNERVLHRATSWFSLFLPGYADTRVSIPSAPGDRNTIVSWSPPPAGSDAGFPNPAVAHVPVSAPWELTVAARATTANFESAWIGSLPQEFGRTPFASDPARPIEQRVIAGDPPRVQLSGVIEHRLNGTLRNVTLVHVWPLRTRPPARAGRFRLNDPQGELPNHGRFVAMSEWPANTPLELGTLFNPGGAMASDERVGSLAEGIRARYNAPFERSMAVFPPTVLTAGEQERAFEMLGMYGMLEPPVYEIPPMNSPDPVRHLRMLGRATDLSLWLTEPCVIVSGLLHTADSPLGVEVDGERVQGVGTVVVRTVFPLPAEAQFVAPTAN